MLSREQEQKLAEITVSKIAEVFGHALQLLPDPGAKVALGLATAMPAVGALAAIMCQKSKEHEGKDYVPEPDHILFTCLLVHNSSDFNRDGNLLVGFDLGYVLNTINQFNKLTVRDILIQLKPGLQEIIKKQLENSNVAFSGSMSKFQPQ